MNIKSTIAAARRLNMNAKRFADYAMRMNQLAIHAGRVSIQARNPVLLHTRTAADALIDTKGAFASASRPIP